MMKNKLKIGDLLIYRNWNVTDICSDAIFSGLRHIISIEKVKEGFVHYRWLRARGTSHYYLDRSVYQKDLFLFSEIFRHLNDKELKLVKLMEIK